MPYFGSYPEIYKQMATYFLLHHFECNASTSLKELQQQAGSWKESERGRERGDKKGGEASDRDDDF